MERVVVTGASRGLGLEFCRQFLREGYAVVAVVRRNAVPELETLKTIWPDRLHTRVLDVTDEAGVRQFGAEMARFPVSILVNNAGQIGPETFKGEAGQNVDTLDLALCRQLFEVNALAPLMLTLALLPSLVLSGRGRSVVMGSTVGCARETFGDYYGYRMGKASAHVAFATLGKDLLGPRRGVRHRVPRLGPHRPRRPGGLARAAPERGGHDPRDRRPRAGPGGQLHGL